MRTILLSLLTVLAVGCAAQNPSIKIKGWMKNSAVASNLLPISNAGVDKVITLPTNSVTFFGSGYDQDGSIMSYLWTQVSGPSTAILTGPTTSTMLAGTLVTGVYQFKLRVTDNKFDTAVDYVTVTVNKALNIAPSVSAGSNQTLTLPLDSTTLTATGADTDGTVDGYAWTQISGPNTSTIATPADDVTIVRGLIEGLYEFEITATDNNGGIAKDRVHITVVAAAVNILPIANAGINQTIRLPINSVQLVSLSTDADGTIVSYSWSSTTGTVSDPTNDSTTVVNLTEGEHVITLTVTDDDGGVSTDEVTITVLPALNLPPTVDAGNNISIVSPLDSATLFANASDPDGEVVTYLWTKVSGPTGGTISSPSTALTVVKNLAVGVYRFQVTVTDDDGATQFSYVNVEVIAAPPVNESPTAEAGSNVKITEPTSSTTLSGSALDNDGVIMTYAWSQVSGPNTAVIQSAALASTLLTGLIPGTYVFQLTVTDDDGATGTDVVTVTVLAAPNVLPQANAGPDKDITLPTNSTTFNGLVQDIDGTIVSITWTKISGPSGGAIASPTAAVTNITGLLEGTYEYELAVADDDGGTGSDRVKIIVRAAIPPNKAPTANAGANVVLTLPANSTTLSGSGADTDGTISSYLWEKVSGPTGGTIGSPSSASTTISSLVQGVYEYRLTVTDDDGATAIDLVQITVNGAANALPTVNAGSDQVITLPTSSVTVTATAVDTDGTIASVVWSWQSGPTNYTIASPSSLSTVINNLVSGVYKFQVRVTDNSGAVATDDVQITVNAAAGVDNGNITFTLATQSHVSAAITRYTDSAVVKTLFSDSIMGAGTHTINCNGTDDFGAPLLSSDPKYIAKIVSNNIRYDWSFTIGNSSDSLTGHTKHRGYYRHMAGLAFAGLYGYYCTGYSEGSPSIAKFLISKPGTKIDIFGPLVNPLDVNYVCTDGNYVYWAYFDPNAGNNTGVFATRCSNDAEVIFPNMPSYDGVASGRVFPSVIGLTNLSGSAQTGLAVQPSGNYLFIARGAINQLDVLHKTTGAFVRSITMPNVRGIWAEGNNLWAVSDVNTVGKYTVNLDGSLSAATLTLPATEPHSVTTNPGGTIASVTEGGLLQQVKHYNATTGAASSTLGTAGGYALSATVTDYKFMFTNIDGVGGGENKKHPFVAYQPDGSYWVNDCWNYRVQRFTSAGVFSKSLGWLGSTYTCSVDPNNTSRVFWGFLEYKVDYLNKTWTLHKNWRNRVSYKVYNIKYDMKFTTLPDGRTWGFITKGNTAELIELTKADTMRPTGVLVPGRRLEPDGRAMVFTRGNIGGTSVMNAYALTSYTGTNPTWSTTPTLIYRTPTLTEYDPNSGPRTQTSIITSTGKVVVFDGSAGATFDPVTNRMLTADVDYNLGILNQGVNTSWFARTQLSTHRNYGGAYPDPHGFDVGNMVNDFAGGGITTSGRYILTNHHDENWKNAQTNYFRLYLDNGVALGMFGTDRYTVGAGVHAAPKMAGNALTSQLVDEPISGDKYVLHGDESDHSALHVWKISNLSSIVQQNVVVNKVTTPVSKAPNIMTGLPFDQILPTSVGNWTRSHPQDSTNKYSSFYSVATSYMKYKKLETPDIFIQSISRAAANKIVEATLGTNNVTTGWRITGKVAYPNSMPNGLTQNQYIDVLDNAGKILIRFYPMINRSVIPAQASLIANTLPMFSGTEGVVRKALDNQLPFEFKILNGVVTITYGSYTKTTSIFDPTGDWHKPTKFRVSHNSTATATGGVYTQTVDVADITYTNLDIL